ncbi:MAG TPA: tol-pal system protein YbgF [Bryobacteraceae bacterium]|nr:tol-pal system protein YbgF [Bryobacteraceae bacterium]
MRALRASFVLLLAIPAAFGQKKEQIADMQRDIASIQDTLKSLQTSQASTLGQIQGMLTSMSTAVDSNNTKVQNQLSEALRQQQQAVLTPVANLNTRLDQMAQSFQELKETILDMNSRLGKLDAKIQDLQTQIQLGRNPAPAPGTAGVDPSGTSLNSGVPSGQAGCPSSMQADSTYSNARRDYMAAHYDLAMQEFSDYARCFPTTQYAPNAQYYVGEIYYNKGDYENAMKAFDTVLEQYPENTKTGDAHYMKGNSLVKLQRKEAAVKEYRQVISKYPESDSASKARTKLRELGVSAGTPRRR